MSSTFSLDASPAPWWLPPKVAEARRFAHFAGLAFLLAGAVHGLLWLASIVQNLPWVTPGWFLSPGALLHLVAIVGCFACAGFVRSGVLKAVDAGQPSKARTDVLLSGVLAVAWVVFGAILAILPAILLAIAWVGLEPARAAHQTQFPAQSEIPPPPDQWPIQ